MTELVNNSYKHVEPVAHSWVVVINPHNHRNLLHACDDCGVVKSENSIIRRCKAAKGKGIISRAMRSDIKMVS